MDTEKRRDQNLSDNVIQDNLEDNKLVHQFSDAMLETILNSSEDMIFFKNKKGVYINCTEAYADYHGLTIQEVIGLTNHDLHNAEKAKIFNEQDKEILKTLKSIKNELWGISKDGRKMRLETVKSPYYDKDGNVLGIIGIIRDVTDKYQVEMELKENRRYLRAVLETSLDAFWVIDEKGNFLDVNSAFSKMSGYSREELLYMKISDLEVKETVRGIKNRINKILTVGKDRFETVHKGKDGNTYEIEITTSLFDEEKGLIVGFARDISLNKAEERKIKNLCFHDHLTEMYNRRYIEDSIDRLDTPRNHPFTIMMLDINCLKLTNDAFGHQIGDQVLVNVAKCVKKACRDDDIIGRLGGDEFIVLLPRTNKLDADKIKCRIQDFVSELEIDSMTVSVAVGYSTKYSDGTSITDIIKEADSMMYRNKIKTAKETQNQIIRVILDNVNRRHDFEKRHSERVAYYCENLAKEMGYGKRICEDVKKAGELHDIGKIVLPEELLNKVEPLSREDYDLFKQHPETSYQILKSTTEYAYLAEIILHHHERWNGSGYPEGLSGEDIPLLSRIIAVADTYEAMTGERPYTKAMVSEKVVEELKAIAGTQLDPELVKTFIEKVVK
ncbi:sensor domain-containing diguanylate cyclase/phosphohydrolase [Gudongella sp. DL1XJH-153]|uniref:sensor domain-containing diguanylate cyclase/phosphohydrolase n=1 Tax=Gudongella sp. DL1XJH-153 TaxID=3409804 RepID=UPI003BB537F8